jgi:glycosyltransferase involved in cell wall biosynthesis
MTHPKFHCLVVTQLDLGNLSTSRHGIFQRFRALLDGAVRAECRISLAVCIPEGVADVDAHVIDLQESFQREWNIDLRVIPLVPGRLPRIPWLLLELAGALSFRLQSFSLLYSTVRNRRELTQLLEEGVDVCIAHRLMPMSLLLAVARSGATRIVFDMDDIEHAGTARIARISPNWRRRLLMTLSIPAIIRAEQRSVERAAVTLVCSKLDQSELQLWNRGNITALANSVEIPDQDARPAPATPAALIMVGVYSYAPNADGAQWFLQEVWPSIRRVRPDVEVWFVGKGAEAIPRELRDSEGVRFVGFVDDLGPIYRGAAMAICPIRAGGGTRIKILEAAAFSIPSVSTTLGAEGLDLQDGEHILLADSSKQFAESCLRLIDDKITANKLGLAARARICERYSRDAQIRQICQILQAQIMFTRRSDYDPPVQSIDINR